MASLPPGETINTSDFGRLTRLDFALFLDRLLDTDCWKTEWRLRNRVIDTDASSSSWCSWDLGRPPWRVARLASVLQACSNKTWMSIRLQSWPEFYPLRAAVPAACRYLRFSFGARHRLGALKRSDSREWCQHGGGRGDRRRSCAPEVNVGEVFFF